MKKSIRSNKSNILVFLYLLGCGFLRLNAQVNSEGMQSGREIFARIPDPEQEYSEKISPSVISENDISFHSNDALAARWKKFTVRRNPAGIVTSEWQVNNPDEAISYTIERSTDKITFSDVETVPALSSGESYMSYALADEQAPAVLVWYRIRENRGDKKTNYSELNKVEEIMKGAEMNLQLTCFPNPGNKKMFFLRLNRAPKAGTTIHLYDNNGELKMNQAWKGMMNSLEDEITLPKEISNGSYYVEITESNIRIGEKIVVD